ncbi:GH25 family lysozyme [Veillonella criceti]|uniref:Lysozyme M1 n=1 Tax=Veillonella criceti TaxID=103891 RepID=A0A380NI91_9FIRM|nr:GH25 family lysozyme [Veillonella criceti]SUP41003.1 Lysozyme M1 precursor [Veillonella criceti]
MNNSPSYGIDISEHNGHIDWESVKRAGITFAVIRLGYGQGHLDSLFYEHVNTALTASLAIGIYYYSYATNCELAAKEAQYVLHTLQGCGLTPAKLPLGVWYDIEDSSILDACEMPDIQKQSVTNIASTFVNQLWQNGYTFTGIYANLNWWTHYLDISQLSCPQWCAQYNVTCDWPTAHMWQYTNNLTIGHKQFDGNIL